MMGMTTEEFITNFHSLTGTTIGERRKNLFLLLDRTKQTTDFERIDFNIIQPKTHLEENFKVQTLLHFRRVPNLIDIFKSENPILIERILKESSWFLEEVFNYITEEDMVEKLFPYISFNAKVKLINKLADNVKDVKRGDTCFAAIEKRYGNYLATKLLPCCSSNLIMQCIKSFKIELTPRQLLTIIKKHQLLIEDILDALNYYSSKDELVCKYSNIFVYILNTDLPLFLKLCKNWSLTLRIGWRSTNRIIHASKWNFINNGDVLYSYLHHKQITKSLHKDFDQFFLKMFPASLSCFKEKMEDFIELMKYLPKSTSKMNLLSSTFQNVYKSELWQHSKCVTKSVLELMTFDERESWMKCYGRPRDMSEVAWICLMKTEMSIPSLTKKISLTSNIKDRAELMGCLVETCRINNDKLTLVDVCKYVATQHRNDNSSVIYCFLNTLKNCYDLIELNEQHWKYINEVLQTFISRKVFSFYYHDFVFAYLEYLFLNDLPVKEYIIDVCKKLQLQSSWHVFLKKEHVQKACFIKFGELIPDIYKDEELTTQLLQYFEHLVQWNQKHPNNKMLVSYQFMIDTVRDHSKMENVSTYSADGILAHLICLDIGEIHEEECFKILVGRSNSYLDMGICQRLIKYKPATVLRHIDFITTSVLKLWYTLIPAFFWTFARNYSHLNIPQKLIEICISTLNSEASEESHKKNAITALACLMNAIEFQKFVLPYYPSDLKMDVNSDEQGLYKIQQAVTASFQHVIPSSVILDSVFDFSKGDYLKFIQRALHSVSYSTAEKNLIPFYLRFADRPVSVRKHPVYFTFKVLDKTEIRNMLTRLEATEKNASILKLIFKASFNYFVKNPTNDLWELVKNTLKLVDVNDTEVFDVLIQIKKVPRLYLSSYLIFTFQFLDTALIAPKKVQEAQTCLLKEVTPDVIVSLPEEFSWGLIDKHLFQAQDEFLSEQVQLFACRFVVYAGEFVERRILNLFERLKRHVTTTWHDLNSRNAGRKCICTFVKHFCSLFLNDKKAPRQALKSFMNIWNDFLNPHEAFDEYLQLKLTSIYVCYIDDDLNNDQLAARLCEVCNGLSRYDCVISTEVGTVFNVFLPRFLKGSGDILEGNRLNLITCIINNQIRICILVAITLLPLSISDTAEVKLSYQKVVEALEGSNDPIVGFYLSLYFNKVALESGSFSTCRENVQRYKPHRGLYAYFEHFTNKYRQ